MGRLKPGATYIYEKANGVTYAREFGSNAEDRFPIGWDAEVNDKLRAWKENRLWVDIMDAAKTNPALQDAIDRVKLLYYMSKEQDGT